MNPLIQLKKAAPVFLVALACFGLLPTTRAVSPPPDGGYPNFTTAEGTNALQGLTTGSANTAVGWYSLFSSADASFNTGVGAGTLTLNTGDSNTAVGTVALLLNTTGTANTAIGTDAMVYNDTGSGNTAVGNGALFSNTTGNDNTVVGAGAFFSNTTGYENTAVGLSALASNTTGGNNTANGVGALQNNTSGYYNTAHGDFALLSNTTGIGNTANGYSALSFNTTSSYNTANGYEALYNCIGSGNIGLGAFVGGNVTTANNVICIGSDGNNEDNSCYIGNIFGATSANGVAVLVNSNGRLGTMTSSARFKADIKPMDKASEALFALKPVAFRYKEEIDPDRTPQLGLVAEDVEKVNRDLVVRDKEGKPYSVRYDQVNAMLLNEFLKEHRKVEQLEKQVEALTAGLQRVSAQLAAASPSRGGLEASKFATGRIRRGGPAPQVVNNP